MFTVHSNNPDAADKNNKLSQKKTIKNEVE